MCGCVDVCLFYSDGELVLVEDDGSENATKFLLLVLSKVLSHLLG